MTVTYDLTNDIGKVRLMSRDPLGAFHSDEEIQVFIDLETGNDIRFAAADALEDIANNQVLLLKMISLSGMSFNGPAVSKDLREAGMRLRQQAMMGIEGMFDWAQSAWSPESAMDIYYRDLQRHG